MHDMWPWAGPNRFRNGPQVHLSILWHYGQILITQSSSCLSFAITFMSKLLEIKSMCE